MKTNLERQGAERGPNNADNAPDGGCTRSLVLKLEKPSTAKAKESLLDKPRSEKSGLFMFNQNSGISFSANQIPLEHERTSWENREYHVASASEWEGCPHRTIMKGPTYIQRGVIWVYSAPLLVSRVERANNNPL